MCRLVVSVDNGYKQKIVFSNLILGVFENCLNVNNIKIWNSNHSINIQKAL